MKELKVFAFDTNAIRTVNIDNEPWFVGKDVASALGYTNTRKAIIDHVDEDDKKDGVTICDPIGREQKPIIINESGMYALIFGSKLEQAKKFKHWVTSEVLPTIRKTGSYSYDKMEIAKMIIECKSATGVKAIMKLFETTEPKVHNVSDEMTDFLKKYSITDRPASNVYRDYLMYSGKDIPQAAFSKKLSHYGYCVKRHRVNGKLTGFYVITEC